VPRGWWNLVEDFGRPLLTVAEGARRLDVSNSAIWTLLAVPGPLLSVRAAAEAVGLSRASSTGRSGATAPRASPSLDA